MGSFPLLLEGSSYYVAVRVLGCLVMPWCTVSVLTLSYTSCKKDGSITTSCRSSGHDGRKLYICSITSSWTEPCITIKKEMIRAWSSLHAMILRVINQHLLNWLGHPDSTGLFLLYYASSEYWACNGCHTHLLSCIMRVSFVLLCWSQSRHTLLECMGSLHCRPACISFTSRLWTVGQWEYRQV